MMVSAPRMLLPVIPAKAGIQCFYWNCLSNSWIPASAGMTAVKVRRE